MKLGTKYLGIAGELRVMSELLLRGHNPSKSYLDDGVDIILENGIKLQVKSSRLFIRKDGTSRYYHFIIDSFNLKQQRKKTLSDRLRAVDFFVFWCLNENEFYIIPSQKLKSKKSLELFPNPNGANRFKNYIKNKRRSRWEIFRNNWDVLNK